MLPAASDVVRRSGDRSDPGWVALRALSLATR